MAIPFLIKKQGTKFKVKDPFNNNILEGYLCRVPDLRYGMLYIEKVNDKHCPQLIWATPKMHYPFDKNGKFNWYRNITKIEVYEKLDGTNILQYRYVDHKGDEYITYKTRLTPVLMEGREYSFLGLWKEAMDMYPEVEEMWYRNNMNISYEIYGTKNHILVRYPCLLDIKILFGRGENGEIISPSAMDVGAIGHPTLITTIKGDSDLDAEYQKIREYLNEHLNVVESEKEVLVEGMEGSVWYAIADRVVQYKCKPDYVMDIHWKAAEGIPIHSIYTTIINSFEEMDIVTVDHVVELLKEEYEDRDIYRKINTIKRLVDELNLKMKLRKQIVEEYKAMQEKDQEFDIKKDKRKVMRYFAEKMREWGLSKKMAGKVYQIIIDNFGM